MRVQCQLTGKGRKFFMKHRLHPAEIALMVLAALILTSGAAALRTRSALADKVVRLHVLANSDSEADQALKLKVRDAVLAEATEALRGTESREEAGRRLTALLPELEETAQSVITENGYAYGVRAELAETPFPTKEYDGFALPAGEYLALRVLIGEAAGQNWWCVVFPPLCTAAACDWQNAGRDAGLAEDDLSLMAEEDQGYQLRFRSVELWEKLRQWLGK